MKRYFSRKAALLLALMTAVCLAGAGCQGDKEEDAAPSLTHFAVPESNSMRVTLYFPTEEPSAFSLEVRQIELPGNKMPGYAVVEQLLKGPQTHLLPACPAGYTLGHVWIIGRVAFIDLHNNGAEDESLSQFRAVAARTLSPVFDVEYVHLTVDGVVPAGLANGLERASEEKETNAIHLLAYYPDENEAYLVPKPRSSDKQTDLWVSAFSLLVSGNEPEGTRACFDDQIKVVSGRVEGDAMMVDLFVPESHTSSSKCFAALAQTLLDNASGLRRVIISANGTPVTGAEGMTQTPGEFTQESLRALLGTHVTTYLANENNSLTAVRRTVPLEQASDALTPIHEMIKGVQPGDGEGLSSILPAGVTDEDILGLTFDHNTAMLDLSDAFFEALGDMQPEREAQLVYGLVNALTDHGGVERVVILQNGHTRDVMALTIVIAKPLLRNPGLIYKP